MPIKLLTHHIIFKWSCWLMGSFAINMPEEIKSCSNIIMAWQWHHTLECCICTGRQVLECDEPESFYDAEDIESMSENRQDMMNSSTENAGILHTQPVVSSFMFVPTCATEFCRTLCDGHAIADSCILRLLSLTSVFFFLVLSSFFVWVDSLTVWLHPVGIFFPAFCFTFIVSKILNSVIFVFHGQ